MTRPGPTVVWGGRGPAMVPLGGAGGALLVDRTPVTRAQFAAFDRRRFDEEAGCNQLLARHARHPINCVSHDEARRYCAWAGKRLPTAVEQRAAAAGKAPGTIAARAGDDPVPTRPVAGGPPSADGVWDLPGSVTEWTAEPQGGDGDPSPDRGFRCVRDRRDAPPALAGRPGDPPIRLLGGEGLCVRRESTRETFCMGGLPVPLGGRAPAETTMVRVPELDTASVVGGGCILWPGTLLCGGDEVPLLGFDVPAGATQLYETMGGAFVWAPGVPLRRIVPFEFQRPGRGLPEREVKRVTTTFDVGDALCVLYADGEHVCDHFGLSDDDRSALVPARVAPPATDGELVVVGCDGWGDSLRCAERDRVTLPRALRSDVAWGALRCVLLDDERLHCLAGDELSLASFATHLPPPVASGIVDVAPVGSRICIATRDERVLCLDATRFEAPGPTPELLVGLQFEPLALPW